MKFIIALLVISFNARADINYVCIADTLQAMNSDIYTNLSAEEIDHMLSDSEALGHEDAQMVLRLCEN